MEGKRMNLKAEIINFEEVERNGAFLVDLMGRIRNGLTVFYSETTTIEIDLKVLDQTFGDKVFFVQYSTDTLLKHLEILIEQKFKISENAY